MKARSLRNSRLVGGASRIRTLSTLWRIWSESEPPNLPTEKNAGCCAFDAPIPPSPVRVRESPTAKTPRNRANFSICSWMKTRSLCNDRLNGGGGSLGRTRLWGEIPDLQGKYREILRNQTLLAASGRRFPSLDAVIATDSLCSGTGNSFRRAGNSL